MQEFYQQLREKITQRQNRQATAPRPNRPSWDDSVLNSSSKYSAVNVRQSTSTGTLRKAASSKNKYGTVSPSMGRQLSSVLAQQIKDHSQSPPLTASDSIAQWKHVNVQQSGASPPSSHTNMYARNNTSGSSLVKTNTLQGSSSGPSSGYSTAPSSGYSTPSSGPNSGYSPTSSGSITVAHVKRPMPSHSKVAAYATLREPKLLSSYGSEFTARRTDPGVAPPPPPPRTPSTSTITVTANKTTAAPTKQQAVRVVQQRAPPTIISSSARPQIPPEPRPRSQSIPIYDNVEANNNNIVRPQRPTAPQHPARNASNSTASPSSSPTTPYLVSSPAPVPRNITVVQTAPRVPSPPQMIKIVASTNKYKQPPPPLSDTTTVPAPPPRKIPLKTSENSSDRRSTNYNPYVYNTNNYNHNYHTANHNPNNTKTHQNNNDHTPMYSNSPNGTRALPPTPKQPQQPLYPHNRY